jgi:hypothetical protein
VTNQGLLFCKKEAKNSYSPVARLTVKSFLVLFLEKGLLAFFVAFLASCGPDEPPVTENFTPLHYDYLPKLRLNVGAIDVQDHSAPIGPQDIASSSPAVPAQALQQMGHDRLFAAGVAGQADFVVDQASIVREPNGTLDGHVAVHLDIIAPNGTHAGFAEAQVSRQHIPGSEPENGSVELYDLTKHMLDDMNVELEFQLKRTLGAYLVGPGDAPAPVIAQPLPVPGAPPPVPAPPALPPATPGDAAPQVAPPSTDGYQDPEAPPPPPPQQMSPPPGFLQLPPGTPPAPAPGAPGY